MNEYYDSEEEVVPATYKIEPAKSGRSTCAKSKELIPLGELRVGWYDKSERIRNYRGWTMLEYWRVPGKVQDVLTNPTDEQQVLRDLIETGDTALAGVSALDEDDAQLLVEHVMNTDHWAGYTRKIVAKENDNEAGNQKASPANDKDMPVEKKAKKIAPAKTKKKVTEVKEIPATKSKKDTKKGIAKKQKVQALKEAAAVAAAHALAEATAAKAKAIEDRKLRAERRLLA